MADFDLIIIGSGSGNTVITADMDHWRIALVEDGAFGGTCLNVGCIPTKMYVYAADVAATVRDSSRFGIDATVDDVRWPAIRDRIFGRIDPISAKGHKHRQDSANVTLFDSPARFVSPTSLQLDTGRTISGERIVVAAGARPVVPELVTAAGVPFHTSETIMRLEQLPERLTIIGGGYVAAEFAHVFAALGTRVTLLVRGPRLLAHLDREVSERFTAVAAENWDVRLEAAIASVTTHGRSATAGGTGIRVALDDGVVVDGDILLVATGRTPNSDRLDLDRAGVEVDGNGRIVVDDYQRTSAPGIWALGDISSPQQLKHVANQDARVVAHNLLHPHDLTASNHRHVPYAVFTQPQLASVGLTEEQAVEAGLEFVTAVQKYGSTAYGWALEDTIGVVKLLCDRATGELLGAHLMGAQASILIQPLIQAMSFGQTVAALARGQYWIHPALSEVIENALLAVDRARRAEPGTISS